MDLFKNNSPAAAPKRPLSGTPLAERMRPKNLGEFVGQRQLLGEGKALRLLIEKDQVPSMIFWGPPGCGKTSLARLIAQHTQADFIQLSAVAAGVQDVRKAIAAGEANRKHLSKRTLLFIDEIHRFNKAQQDALLHSIEDGDIILIGATTENPSFEVISPLLSRCRVYVLEPLGAGELNEILDRALTSDDAMSKQSTVLGPEERERLMLLSGGDARVLLNGLETAARLASANAKGEKVIAKETLEEAFQARTAKYDKGGEEHYNIISAFIKSMRGSDPDASVYWLARMLDGGEDPKFIARRMVILASEDIGNADPNALVLATSCFTAIDYIGMPEAALILSQTAVYLASAPKSNASMRAIAEAASDVKNLPNLGVPLHLRNAPTKLLKDLRYGAEYKYSHDYDEHFSEQQYLPDNLKEKVYYKPADAGFEKSLRERLNHLWKKKQR
ncbi:MAG TPA: replication-associated recombination protein A [Bacteroidota bacterium]|nr:replication-associated recombination protein A [Bacteroidota bacterium]